MLEAVACPGPKLIEAPTSLGHADDRHVEVAAFRHRLQRREDFLVGQIARGAKKDQGVRLGCVHGEPSCAKMYECMCIHRSQEITLIPYRKNIGSVVTTGKRCTWAAAIIIRSHGSVCMAGNSVERR